MESPFSIKDLEVQVDNLSMTQECALESKTSNGILGCTRVYVASGLREVVVFSLFGTKEPISAVLASLPGSPVQRRYEHTGKSPVKGHKGDYGTGERKMVWFSMEKGRLRGDLINA